MEAEMQVIHDTPDFPPEEMPRIYEGQYVNTPKGDGIVYLIHKGGVVVRLSGGYYTGKTETVEPK